MRAVFDTAARRWRHRILPRLPGCQHGRTGPQAVLPLPPDLSRRKMGRRSRTASAMPRNGGWPGTAPTSLTSGLSISATICLPASRSLPPSKMPAATSSSPASQLRIRRLLIPAGRRTARTSSDHLQTRQAHHHHLPLAQRRAAARHGRCHPGQLVLHRDLQRQGTPTDAPPIHRLQKLLNGTPGRNGVPKASNAEV